MQQLKTLKYLNFIAAGLFAILGVLILLFFFLPWKPVDDAEVPLLHIRLIGILSALLVLGLAAAHLLVGWLVGAHRGRIFQSFLALLHISSFPIGTAYAAYALWLCWLNEPTRKAFDSPIKPWVT